MNAKTKERLLLFGSTIVTLLISLVLLRQYAPHLLGVPVDLQMVKTAKEVPPFFENIFREEDRLQKSFIIPDPILKRAQPLVPDFNGLGPNDLMGFRNRSIPSVADVVVIGDSQTYGNNAYMDNNWPNQFGAHLTRDNPRVTRYDMAVGGWGAVEYLEVFYKALYLKPRVVVVAFYTGNDSLDSFRLAYSHERWRELKADPELGPGDAPTVPFPPPDNEQWSVSFANGWATVFTPNLRLASNADHPAANAGYRIMEIVAERIAKFSAQSGITPYFTIIPTKELVFAKRVAAEKLLAPAAFNQLVESEARRIAVLSQHLKQIDRAHYVDVVEALQNAANGDVDIYPITRDGHPVAAGYKVIGDAVASQVTVALKLPPGLFGVTSGGARHEIALLREDRLWTFATVEWVAANGWTPGQIPLASPRDIANIPRGGIIDYAAPERFGPRLQ